jgi:hypothetical protein
MDLNNIRSLCADWKAGTFEILEHENRIVGYYEAKGAFDSKNSIFIDSIQSDFKREEAESRLSDLLEGTCFRRCPDEDLESGDSFSFVFEAELTDAQLVRSLLLLLER